MVCVTDEHVDMLEEEIELILSNVHIEDDENIICSFILSNSTELEKRVRS